MKLRAVIERITYQNGENGYSILKARVKGYDDLVTLVGNMLDVTVGTVLVADGQWKVNRQYGSQFVVESYEEAMPATLFGLEKYLGSGLVKGIGPKFSKLIVAKFGMDTPTLVKAILKDLNCKYEESDDHSDYVFSYQGENFVARAPDKYNPRIRIFDLDWYHCPLSNLEEMSCMQKAINAANTRQMCTAVYYIDNDRKEMSVYSKANPGVAAQWYLRDCSLLGDQSPFYCDCIATLLE